MRYEITLKDTATNEVVTFEWVDPITRSIDPSEQDEQIRYYWEEGNLSCDCNRDSYFGHEDGSCNDERYNLQKIVNLITGQEVALLFPENVK